MTDEKYIMETILPQLIVVVSWIAIFSVAALITYIIVEMNDNDFILYRILLFIPFMFFGCIAIFFFFVTCVETYKLSIYILSRYYTF